MKKDLLEVLKNSIGCTYISDLMFEPYKSQVSLELTDFSLNEFSDFFEYLFSEKQDFTDYEQVSAFLKTTYKVRDNQNYFAV